MAGCVRFMFAVMLCIANMIIYGLKVNIATAIIGMVKKTGGGDSGKTASVACPDLESSDHKADIEGPFEWSTTEQGLVVSLYFAGYMIGMFPCGYAADRFNTKWVLLIAIYGNAVFTLLVPLAAKSIYVLLAIRFLTGLISSCNLPVVNVLVGKWVIYEEKTMLFGMIYGGTSIGTVISILSSGLIMNAWGWEAVFYIHGTLPLIWCVVFMFFFADNPETQKYISEEERDLICNSYGHRKPQGKTVKVPWKSMFTSVPFWALVVANTFGNTAWYFLLTQLPTFMNKILRFDIKANAGLSCTPYLLNALVNPCIGRILDFGRKREIWSITTARKIAVTISCLPPSIMLIVIGYVSCQRILTVVLLFMSIITTGAIFLGHLTNHNDLAPNFAGILMGITNTPGTLSAFILPALVGWLTEDGHTYDAWRKAIWINVAAQLLAWIIFIIFGTGKIQEWNTVEDEEEEEGEELAAGTAGVVGPPKPA